MKYIIVGGNKNKKLQHNKGLVGMPLSLGMCCINTENINKIKNHILNWIKKFLQTDFVFRKKESPQKQEKYLESLKQEVKSRFCKYTENPFSTDFKLADKNRK